MTSQVALKLKIFTLGGYIEIDYTVFEEPPDNNDIEPITEEPYPFIAIAIIIIMISLMRFRDKI